MSTHQIKLVTIIYAVLLGFCLLIPTGQAGGQESTTETSSGSAKPVAADEVDARVAGMSDHQVRQAYAQKLKQEAAKPGIQDTSDVGRGTMKIVAAKFYGAARVGGALLKRIGNIFSGESQNTLQWQDAVNRLSEGKGGLYLFWAVLGLAVIVAIGLAARSLFQRATANIQESLMNAVRLGKLQFLGRVLSRVLLDALGVGIYILVTFIGFVLVYREGEPNYIIVSIFLILSYYIIVLAFGARVIFSPKAASLRLFPMEDQDASFLYKWFLRIIFIPGFFAGTSAVFNAFNVSGQLYLLIYSSSGAVVILALMIMIWQSRKGRPHGSDT